MEREILFVGHVPPHGSKEAGVYLYKQVSTGKTYIGSTIDAYGRYVSHSSSLKRGSHVNRKFQQAFDRDPFFQIHFCKLHEVDLPTNERIRRVREMEQSALDGFEDKSNLLNLATDAFACGTNQSPSLETREKIRQSMLGREVSEETRQRRSATMKGARHTDERKMNISNSRTQQAVSVDGVVYRNIVEATVRLGFANKNSVRFRCLSTNYPNYQFVDKTLYQLGNSPSL